MLGLEAKPSKGDIPLTFKIPVMLSGGEKTYLGIVDSGATCSCISSSCVPVGVEKRGGRTVGIQVGDGNIIWSSGVVDIQIPLGPHLLTLPCMVIDTTAFEVVIGTDLSKLHPNVKSLKAQPPYGLVVEGRVEMVLYPTRGNEARHLSVPVIHHLSKDLRQPLGS